MNKTLIGFAAAVVSVGSMVWAAQSVQLNINLYDDTSIDAKVAAMLAQMTLEEKVGQMTQLTLQAVTQDGTSAQLEVLDSTKLTNAIVTHHIGSVLNVISHAETLDYWQQTISTIQNMAVKQTRLGIPIIYGIDGIHGATYTVGSTLFPQGIGMAATWNKDLVQQEGTIVATEVKASGIPWNFYPVLDVARQPLWSRVYETFGEDPFMASTMGSIFIQAHQSMGVANCLKHYVGYSDPLSGADRTPAVITERELRDTFLPSFAAGVLAGSPSVMVNSAQIDGVPGHANHHLLVDVLRGELGFKGFTVSDWGDIENLYTRDRVASSPEDAVRIAVMAGVDMSMVPMDYTFYDLLIDLVKKGDVPMSRIDEAVGRILKVKYTFGLFDHPMPDANLKSTFATTASTATNLSAAQESITLLKNTANILPLKKSAKVLVTGPNANLLSRLNGGWTITWQGDEESLYPKDKKTILAAIQDKIGASHVKYAETVAQAVKAAASGIDYAIVCIGEKTYAETPGNITDLTMDADQLAFAEQLEASKIPVILVITEGRPRVMRSVVDDAKGILMAYYPGMEGGRAIADILFGDVNPSGKLPYTYPRSTGSLTLYDHTPAEEENGNVFNPEFEFGFGLSYTTFKYDQLKIDHDPVAIGDSLQVSVVVTNTGKVAGKEVAELFLTQEYASIMRPVKQLKGFEKVLLQPGESKTVQFTLHPDAFSFVNEANVRVTEPGAFVVMVGGQVQQFNLK